MNIFDLRQKLLDIKDKHGHADLAPSQLTRYIRRAVGDKAIKIQTQRSTGIDPNDIIVSGAYDSEDDKDNEPCIELNIGYSRHQDTLCLNDCNWDRYSFDIAECIGHEYVHREQYRKKRANRHTYTPHPLSEDHDEQEYLGNNDEVEAYGYTIAAELAVFHNGVLGMREEVFMYQQYTKTFAHDQSVVLKLNDYIVKYLSRLEVMKCAIKKTSTKKSTKQPKKKPTKN
jgi:hypothetical protein